MIYRNIKTGAEIISTSVICSPEWMLVEANTQVSAPKEAPKPEPPKAEPKKEEPVKKEAPRAAAKKSKSAPKKRAKK